MNYVVYPTDKWHNNIYDMHSKFGVHDWMEEQLASRNYDNIKEFMKFRLNFLKEELDETIKAVEEGDAEEIVDGLIDLCVVAIGTLDAFGCDSHNAWSTVMEANMKKEIGIKHSRPNPLGLPDLVKPKGWRGPDHTHTTGILEEVYRKVL